MLKRCLGFAVHNRSFLGYNGQMTNREMQTEAEPFPPCPHRHEQFSCDWLQTMLVVLCDGKVVCGCADPYGERPLGLLSRQSLLDIWHSEKVTRIRHELNQGHCCFCDPCGLKRRLAPGEQPPQYPVHHAHLPRIFLEPTAACNLDCFEAVCNRESGILKTRTRPFFPLDEFKTLMDEIGPNLGRLDLFNYGDPFVHPQALDMIEYVKGSFPHVYLYVSTNGLLLDAEKNRRLVDAGLDEITFSVDGPDQRIYEKYRRGGDFSRVLQNMKDLVAVRREMQRELPLINWRCILFKWNDSAWTMRRVRRLAEESGVDRLSWEITDHPPSAKSARYQIGTRAWKRIHAEIWDSSQLSNAIRSRRHLARLRVLDHQSRIQTGGSAGRVRVQVKNIGGALWRKQTAVGRQTIRLGAQLYNTSGKLVDLNFARAFLPRDLARGESALVESELPSSPGAGRYRIKLDMVSEGVDWFERAGSRIQWLDWEIV